MNFSTEQVARLLAGKLVQVVVPKKEGEEAFYPAKGFFKGKEAKVPKGSYFCIHSDTKDFRVKFQVGKSYAVILGGKAAWYCPKCKAYETTNYPGLGINGHKKNCRSGEFPLRFVVKSIKSQSKNWVLEGVKA